MNALNCYLCSSLIFIITTIVLLCLYTYPNQPGISIVDFSVPALNKTLNESIIGDIYFDLKLRNMNKAISLYYVDPFNVAISYNPLEDPSQTYVWEHTLPPFFQGNGNTKHIRMFIGQPSTVVHKEDNTTGKVVNFKIDLLVSYQYNYWIKGDVHKIETGGEVVIDAQTGNRVSKDKIKLESEDSKEVVTTYQFLGEIATGDVSHMNAGIFIAFVIYSLVVLDKFPLQDYLKKVFGCFTILIIAIGQFLCCLLVVFSSE